MDIDTFNSLYENLWLKVYTAAFKNLADSQIATEFTREAFFQLWIRKEDVDTANALGTLFTALRHELLKLNNRQCIYIDIFPGEFFNNMPRYCAN